MVIRLRVDKYHIEYFVCGSVERLWVGKYNKSISGYLLCCTVCLVNGKGPSYRGESPMSDADMEESCEALRILSEESDTSIFIKCL